jgi:hypothetical protein
MLAASAAVAGCGPEPDGVDRRAVSGAVTLDGKPLPKGDIVFNPTGPGASAGGTINDGRYAIDRPLGPSAGPYQVLIYSVRPTGRKVPDPEGPRGSTVDEMANVIPERYNVKTGLKAEVTKDGTNRFDFDLTSAAAKRNPGGGSRSGGETRPRR